MPDKCEFDLVPLQRFEHPKPYYRYESFHAYGNGDAGDGYDETWHILVVCDSSGFIIADKIGEQEDTEWIAKVLTAALQQAHARNDTRPPSSPTVPDPDGVCEMVPRLD